jgi:hypothetical protein
VRLPSGAIRAMAGGTGRLFIVLSYYIPVLYFFCGAAISCRTV